MNRGQVIPFSRHCCPSCGRPMRLMMSVPRFGTFPELHTYECQSCGVTYTEAAKKDDEPEALEDA